MNLRDGLLLTDINLVSLIRDIVGTCKQFVGLIDRWGGDGVPDQLAQGAAGMIHERSQQMKEVGKVSYVYLHSWFE